MGVGERKGEALITRLAGVISRVLLVAFGVAAVVGIGGEQAPAWAQARDEPYVADSGFESILVYARTASGNTAPLRTIVGAATGLSGPRGVALDPVHDELMVTNSVVPNSITVYARTASGNTVPLRILTGEATGLDGPRFLAIGTSGLPTASVALNELSFNTGQQITYQATLTPGSAPTQVDIYLGCLLPDFATFLSLVQSVPGVISITLVPSPIPFLGNVTLVQTVVQFAYTFAGFESAGIYFPYAGLAMAGSNPLISTNQLSLGVQPFQFSP